jgi:hypothetical protein
MIDAGRYGIVPISPDLQEFSLVSVNFLLKIYLSSQALPLFSRPPFHTFRK